MTTQRLNNNNDNTNDDGPPLDQLRAVTLRSAASPPPPRGDHHQADDNNNNINGSNSSSSLSLLSSLQQSHQQKVFDSIGVLEQVLAFCDTRDVVAATAVNRRWNRAGRYDEIWKARIQQSWQDKKGMSFMLSSDDGDGTTTSSTTTNNLIFWRSLFTRDMVRALKQDDVLGMFRHPLLQTPYKTLQDEIANSVGGQASPEFLQRFVQVHMLDVMSEGTVFAGAGVDRRGNDNAEMDDADTTPSRPRRIFFSDLYFGSYASSVMDSKRSIISQQELCSPFGFEMHFKIEEDDADDVIAETTSEELQRYEDAEGILLYRHSTCHFRPDRDFRLVLRPNVAPTYRPNDLRWRWLQVGSEIQVGPYPSLTVSRTKDWGWKLENLHVVMFSNDGAWPPPERQFEDDGMGHDDDDHDSWSSDDSSDSSGILDDDDDFLDGIGL